MLRAAAALRAAARPATTPVALPARMPAALPAALPAARHASSLLSQASQALGGALAGRAAGSAAVPATPASVTLRVRAATDALMKGVVLPMNRKHYGPLEDESDERTPMPFVFLLGNHSSGKSSFINHVLERRVQNTGVAPTDDGFTIIMPGSKDADQAGPSLIGDPDMGFSGLRAFGPSLIHHTQLKIRKDLAIKDIILVDSPGMIDSPTDSVAYSGGSLLAYPPKHAQHAPAGGEAGKSAALRMDRGYDFEGTARWFAERADVILLFFDPDKPGTTGETLSVLTNSLAGLDHKLHIVLNKVDQFKKIHDFARAYGSLCWNLSKVIPRKDLPRIYTMYTPVGTDKGNAGREPGQPQPSQQQPTQQQPTQQQPSQQQHQGEADLSWQSSLSDLEAQRQDVIDEILRAPDRRIDNMTTHLYDSARLLRMHLVMSEAVRADYNGTHRRIQMATVGIGLAGNLVGLSALVLAPHVWSFSAVLSASSIAGAAGVYLYGNYQLQLKAKDMSSNHFLESVFGRVYVREIADRDQFVLSLWHRVKLQLRSAIVSVGAANLPRVTGSDLRKLDAVIDEQVPDLRRMAAPLER
jgi:hypothetical protein